MADQKDTEGLGGGKFPNRAPNKDKGIAIEEFVDESAVNRPAPPPTSGKEEKKKPGAKFSALGNGGPSKIGSAVETALSNPLLLIATAAALPLLLVFWGISRKRRRDRDDEYDIAL